MTKRFVVNELRQRHQRLRCGVSHESTVTLLRWIGLLALLLTIPPVPRVAQAEDASPQAPAKVRVYIGTYTRGVSKGIYLAQLDTRNGALSQPVVAGEAINPSFVALHPTRDLLYSVGEVGDFAGRKSGAVNAFRVDPQTGLLTFLNAQPSGGAGACHVSVDHSGRNVLVANYGGGSASVVPIRDDGSLGEPSGFVQHEGSSVDPRRQSGPHAHSINLDPANRFAFVADLGLDRVMIYRFDAAKGTLVANDPPWAKVAPGAGPRHFAFHSDGRFAYVINEMQSTVTAFRYDSQRGSLEEIQTVSTLPQEFSGENTTAEVQVHPSGRFLYGSNRGHDSIAVFSVDADTGRLRTVEQESTQGKTPRNFGIDPSGRFLLAANQASDSIVVFRIDPARGVLEPAGHRIEVASPVCVRMVRVEK